MQKSKTSNTFEGGMIQDSSPLNASQQTLRDCLNGTLITNDGDEMILQNDMGNARVYQIHLDNGYVPIGMCVYGGVTYIASYNPLTNKGQVGSFPSPQETFFSHTWGTVMKTGNITLGKGIWEAVCQIFPTDTVIRPGDKFDLFCDNSSPYFKKELLSHTDNVTGTNPKKIKSPKNKAITISVCIADSNGNLHDITNTLQRFSMPSSSDTQSAQTIIPYSEDSLLKLNDGTIFQLKPEDNNVEGESQVDKYAVEPKNIYNHKISGNLYLVYRLNVLDNFDISVEFFKGPLKDKRPYLLLADDTELKESASSGTPEAAAEETGEEVEFEGLENNDIKDKTLDVVFDVNYRYNCPDGYYNGSTEDTPNTGLYDTLYGTQSDYDPDKVLEGIKVEQTLSTKDSTSEGGEKKEGGDTSTETGNKLLPFDATNSALSKPVYDYDTDLYTSRQRYLEEGINIDTKDIIKFVITPSTYWGDMDVFRQEITADLNKLNSGQVIISRWKYFVENDGVTISWGLESYPFVGTRLTDVRLEFYNLSTLQKGDEGYTPDYEYLVAERTSYHGNFTSYVNFNRLKKRQVYCVRLSYKLTNIVNNTPLKDRFTIGFRILITTKLYNELYGNNDIPDVNDYKDKYGELYERLHTYKPQIVNTLEERYDHSFLKTSGSPILGFCDSQDENTASKETRKITKTKYLDMAWQVISTMQHEQDELYPFDVRDEKYTYATELKYTDEEGESQTSGTEGATKSPAIFVNALPLYGEQQYTKAVQETIESAMASLVPTMDENGNLKLTNNLEEVKDNEQNVKNVLKSELQGKELVDYPITFSQALMSYFPRFLKKDNENVDEYTLQINRKYYPVESEDIVKFLSRHKKGDKGYTREQHDFLFGYHGREGELMGEPNFYIHAGVTYRGLGNHRNHHGVKYIEVNLNPFDTGGFTGEDNRDKFMRENRCMKDLHYELIGATWDLGDSIDYAYGDHQVEFSIHNFMGKTKFPEYASKRQFTYFWTNKPPHLAVQNEGFTYEGKPHTYKSDYITNWVTMDRKGAKDDDRNIARSFTKPLLLWYYNGLFYVAALLKKEYSNQPTIVGKRFSGWYWRDPLGARKTFNYKKLDEDNGLYSDMLGPESFCEYLYNIYTCTGERDLLCRIISPNTNGYNSDYKIQLDYTNTLTTEYKIYYADQTVLYDETTKGADGQDSESEDHIAKRLQGVLESFDPKEETSQGGTSSEETKPSEQYKKDLEPYVTFKHDKDKMDVPIRIFVDMEGMDDMVDQLMMIKTGVYSLPILISDEESPRLFTMDAFQSPLVATNAYEIATDGESKTEQVYRFGSKDKFNVKNKKKLMIENGRVYPVDAQTQDFCLYYLASALYNPIVRGGVTTVQTDCCYGGRAIVFERAD